MPSDQKYKAFRHLEGQNLLSQFTRRTSLMKNAYLQRRLEDVSLFP